MIHSKRALEGELEIDHRESPGIVLADVAHAPAAFREQTPVVGKGERYLSATLSCTHCQRIVIINPLRTKERHYCAKCDHYICDRAECVLMANGTLPHKTMQQLFDELQRAALQAMAIQEI